MLTISQCCEHVRHSLAGPPSIESEKSIVGRAASWISNAHLWEWLIRPQAHLNLRGSVTVAAGTWAHAAKTLTIVSPASALASYTRLDGDEFRVTGGTGATLGYYTVDAANTATNVLTLHTSIGSAADTQTNITGTLSLPSVALPSDFGNIVAILPDEGIFGEMRKVSYLELLALRTRNPAGTAPIYYYAITWADSPAAAQGAPTPRLELDRVPSANTTAAFLLIYRARFSLGADDNFTVRVPEFMENVFLRACRAYARSYDEDDATSADVRLAQITGSDEWHTALSADGRSDDTVGNMSGGASAQYFGASTRMHRTDVVIDVP